MAPTGDSPSLAVDAAPVADQAARGLRWQAQRERSNPLALRLIVWIARHLGRGAVRALLVPVTTYFVLTGGPALAASRDFLGRVLGRAPRWAELWRHFHHFAAVTVDRIYMLIGAGHRLDIRLHEVEPAVALARRGGCLMLVAHVGSFEVLRGPAVERFRLPLRILLNRAQNRMFMELMERLNPELAASTIDAARPGPELVLAMKEALERGAMIGLMADRAAAGERTVEVQFMGRPAQLPAAPWLLAGALGVPVMIAFCLYRGGRRYDAYFEILSQRVRLPRAGREAALRAAAQGFADRLEHHARSAPYNWFNFYDFWAAPPGKRDRVA